MKTFVGCAFVALADGLGSPAETTGLVQAERNGNVEDNKALLQAIVKNERDSGSGDAMKIHNLLKHSQAKQALTDEDIQTEIEGIAKLSKAEVGVHEAPTVDAMDLDLGHAPSKVDTSTDAMGTFHERAPLHGLLMVPEEKRPVEQFLQDAKLREIHNQVENLHLGKSKSFPKLPDYDEIIRQKRAEKEQEMQEANQEEMDAQEENKPMVLDLETAKKIMNLRLSDVGDGVFL